MSASLIGREIAGKIANQKTAFGKTLEGLVGDTKSPFTAEMKASALEHFDHYANSSGGLLTSDALGAIQKDVTAGLKPGQGASMASVNKGNFLTNAFNVDAEAGIGGNLAAMGMGGLLGMGGALATDGDAAHGAFIGSLVGGGIKGIGTGIAKNLDTKFTRDLLGDAADSFSPIAHKPAETKKVATGLPPVKGIKYSDLFSMDTVKDTPIKFGGQPQPHAISKSYGEIAETHPNLTARELFENVERNAKNKTNPIAGMNTPAEDAMNIKISEYPDHAKEIHPFYADPIRIGTVLQDEGKAGAIPFRPDLPSFDYNVSQVPIPGTEVAAQSVRQQQIAAIGNMSDDALKEAGFGASFKKDVMTGDSGFNIGTATRMSGFAGAALTGMGFSSKKRDHRRGFNKHRGNRV